MSDLPPAPGEGEPPPGSAAEAGFTPSTPEPQETTMNTLAVVGLVVSILALVFFPIGIVALLLGLVALQQINKEPARYRGRGLAIAAVVIGAIETALAVLLLIVFD